MSTIPACPGQYDFLTGVILQGLTLRKLFSMFVCTSF